MVQFTSLPLPYHKPSYTNGSFRKLGVPYFGVLYDKCPIYYLGYYIRVPYFRKLPNRAKVGSCLQISTVPGHS